MATSNSYIQCNLEWISSAHNKVADCLSRLVEVPRNKAGATSILINSVTSSPAERPANCTWSKTKASVEAVPQDTTKANAPSFLTGDDKDTLLKIQQTDPFCRYISKWLINGKTPHHESDTFIYWTVYSISIPCMPLRNFGTSNPQIMAFYNTH